jgi:hypothetical protein
MAYASDADVQIHLPMDKINWDEIPDDKERAVEDSDRTIRGYLLAVLDSATLDLWIDPDSTPEQVRQVSGLLTAALVYRLRYSEDSLDDPQYAQNLYNMAMGMIEKILNGTIVLEGVDDVTTEFDNTYFLPNDATTDTPKFTMGARF